MQQGPHNDPALMYLLARTQALSGRPDDALVMLRRLAELGVAPDVSADDFRRTRNLPGWPAVEAVIAGIGKPATVPSAPAAPVAPAVPVAPAAPVRTRGTPPMAPKAPLAPKAPAALVAPAAPPAPEAPAALVAPVPPVLFEDAGHFSSREFSPGGLACDAVSRRFVFGDQAGRRLLIVTEGGTSSIDLTRAASAGFLDVMALDVDTTNGNLWVVSAEADGRVARLHKLQLVSGRALTSYDVPADLAPVRPIDLTVTASGTVLILDAARRRVLELRPGAAALDVAAELRDETPASLVAANRDGVAYVAHHDGLSRIDLRTRVVSPLAGPKGTPLGGIERLRRHATGLLGVQTLPDGSRRMVRLALDATGRVVTGLVPIAVPLPSGTAPHLRDGVWRHVGVPGWPGRWHRRPALHRLDGPAHSPRSLSPTPRFACDASVHNRTDGAGRGP